MHVLRDSGDEGTPPDEGPGPWPWCGLALLSTFLPFALNWGVIGVAESSRNKGPVGATPHAT